MNETTAALLAKCLNTTKLIQDTEWLLREAELHAEDMKDDLKTASQSIRKLTMQLQEKDRTITRLREELMSNKSSVEYYRSQFNHARAMKTTEENAAQEATRFIAEALERHPRITFYRYLFGNEDADCIFNQVRAFIDRTDMCGKLNAVKHLRTAAHIGLHDAKIAIDALQDELAKSALKERS